MAQVSLSNENWIEVFSDEKFMKNLLDHVSCFDIQRLRKVSYQIRNCIDIIKPDPQIQSITIKGMNINQFDLVINLKNESAKIGYHDQQSICMISANGTIKHVASSYIPALLSDFNLLLENQKSVLNELRFEFLYESYFQVVRRGHGRYEEKIFLKEISSDLLEEFKMSLTSRCFPLRVEKLYMEVQHEEDVMKVLPHLDANFLKSIELRSLDNSTRSVRLRLDQIATSKQWKKAERLIADTLVIVTPLQEINISHFTEVDICVDEITSDDISYLKEKLLNSNGFKKFKISFLHTSPNDSIDCVLGPSYFRQEDQISDERKVWYYGTRNPHFIIIVLYYVSSSFTFFFVDIDSIPKDAVVQK
ncbi:hypothetical protein CAEBREN_12723 [Caenorhabditis brenneri]|uniref:DUF38 domain-containing protein n=1 Tax=Caenorhabditis brenneri TaxID=135651 RepID=G0P660_CAEBE|nr:hypothetical protein CAEBREN_12723 [Caenorhabditis brenneri]